ncbi:MAG: tetratricopeptide repeat protein [Lentisphaerae bacterium]|nr:tetratricopeptide repeat protein [Lentisphaerota bacterium]
MLIMNNKTIKELKICCGSVRSFSLHVFTVLLFLSSLSGFAQQKKVETSLTPTQKNQILDQRSSYQEREAKIKELVTEGVQLQMKQDYDMAIDKYLAAKKIADDVLAVAPTAQRFKDISDKCAAKIADAYFYWAQSYYKDAVKSANENDYDLAIEKCRKAIEIYPPCKEKMEKIIERYSLMKSGVQFKHKVDEAKPAEEELRIKRVLLRQGQVFYNTKQWDKARAKFEEVIVLDPYNETAIDYIRRINEHLSQAGRIRFGTVRDGRNAAAAWEMVTPLISQEISEREEKEVSIIKSSNNDKVLNKLKEIIIDKISFEEVSIPTAFRYLRQCSKEKDPEKIGVNFVLRGKINETTGLSESAENANQNNQNQNQNQNAPVDTEVTPLTMELDNIPLETVIKYICKLANLKYRVDENAVVIASKDVPLDDVVTKVYPLDNGTIVLPEGQTIQDFLSEKGITFEAGSSAVYKDYIGRLIMTNTPKEHKSLEAFLASQSKEDPQVLIQTKFVEVKLNDLEELGFKYSFSRSNSNVQYKYADSNALTAVAEGESFTSDKITNIYAVDSSNTDWVKYLSTQNANQKYTNTNTATVYYAEAPLQASSVSYSVGGTDLVRTYNQARTLETSTDDGKAAEFTVWNRNGYKLNTQIFALDQADSADVLSCPRVTTMHDTTATIQLVTEKYFPNDWDEAEYTIMGNNVPVFTGSVPQLDDETQLGISLEVMPFVSADLDVINVIMRPLIRKFTGWDDYSYTVPMKLNDNSEAVNVPNTMIMPRIEQRTVDTSVSCSDNGTIVLGGMIRDEVSMLEDKYPVLGDLPLIGRFFQSKGRSSQKYNLLIFLSCRLVRPDGSPLREREERGLPPFKY